MTSTSSDPVAFETIAGQYIHSHHQISQDTWTKAVVLKLPGQSDANTTISDAIGSIEAAVGNRNPMSVHSMSNLVEAFNNPDDARLAATIDEKSLSR